MSKKKSNYKRKWHRLLFVPLALLLCLVPTNSYGQQKRIKAVSQKTIFSGVPENYYQVGNTDLYYSRKQGHIYVENVSIGSIDLIGKFGNSYYSSTYGDYGYVVAMQVGSNAASFVDCLTGTILDGVTFRADVEAQGAMARMYYTITNTNDSAVSICLGVYDDVYVGDRIDASISRKKDTFGNTYGISLEDGAGAQLCVLFGDGLAGVTGVSDYWFGDYYLNTTAYAMSGHYSSGSNFMVENGQYDCGIGWCWQDVMIDSGETKVFSYLITIGDVNLEPESSFEVTPDDPEGWNDLSRPHRLSLNGSYESPAGLEGIIDYAVEDSEDWIALTDTLASGDEFTASLVAMFDATKPTHVIKFRTRDLVGNTTMLHPIEYVDVSFHTLTGIENKTYTGDSLFQSGLTCDLNEEQYSLIYHNNINAGTASFNLEGVFPYTIGRKTYTFTINPQSLSGELTLSENEFVYNGESFTPAWSFTNGIYGGLEEGKDYDIVWSDNRLPGTGSLTVSGKNNYTGSIGATFNIYKAKLTENLYSLVLPNEDITYDEQSHGASITTAEGVGEATFSYMKQGETELTTTRPTEAGDYTIYLEFADGTLYYGQERTQVGTFSIYQFSAEEWAILQTVLPQLSEMGWSQPWDVSQGIKSVSSLHGLTIEKGHVTGLDLAGQNLIGMFPYFILALPQLQNVNFANNHLIGDIGTAIYAFAQQNPTLVANVQNINISGNQFSGNIGIFANCFVNLTSLDVSDNCLEDVYPMIPSTVTNLNISKQTISRVVPLHLANLSVDSIATKVPSILLYDHANQTFTPNINLLCTTSDNTWGMTMAYQNGALAIPYVSEQNVYYGENGDTLNVAVLHNNGTREGSTFKIALFFDQGDVNFVNGVDATDLQATILYAFDDYRNLPFNHTAADTYRDFNINVQDVICLVNILLEGTSAMMNSSALQTRSRASLDSADESGSYIYKKGNQIFLRSNAPIASISIRAVGHVNWNVEKYGMMQSVHNGNMVSYSLCGVTLPANEDIVIGECDDNVTIHSASMSDIDANPVNVSILNSNSTFINSIDINVNNADIYDVSGVKRKSQTKGVNIIRQNGKTTKLFNK